MTQVEVKFAIGELVYHLKYHYRGVIFDVDGNFCGSDQWYDEVAKSKPPKDKPWYHILPDGQSHSTYVSEQHLTSDTSSAPINHPALKHFFCSLSKGRYLSRLERS